MSRHLFPVLECAWLIPVSFGRGLLTTNDTPIQCYKKDSVRNRQATLGSLLQVSRNGLSFMFHSETPPTDTRTEHPEFQVESQALLDDFSLGTADLAEVICPPRCYLFSPSLRSVISGDMGFHARTFRSPSPPNLHSYYPRSYMYIGTRGKPPHQRDAFSRLGTTIRCRAVLCHSSWIRRHWRGEGSRDCFTVGSWRSLSCFLAFRLCRLIQWIFPTRAGYSPRSAYSNSPRTPTS